MKLSTESLGNLHQIIHVEILAEDYKQAYSKQIKDLTKKVQMPGFRVGHTPASIIEKRFGDSVLAEELNKIVNEQVGKYLKENEISLLGEALPVNEERMELNYREPLPYTFSYELGIQPHVDLTDNFNKEKVFSRLKIAAKEEEIDSEIGRLLKRYGNREDVETAEDGDVIYVHLQELNEDGSENEQGIHAHTFFNQEMLTETGAELFKSVSKNEQKQTDNIFSLFKGEKNEVAKNILMQENTDEAFIESISPKFLAKIERISRLQPAELGDKFYNEVVKEYGEVENEVQLRQKIKEVIESFNDQSTEIHLENEMYKYLNETTHIELPDAFLRKWFERTQEIKSEDADFETKYEEFLKRLKQSIIFQNMQRKHQFEVSKEEVMEETFKTVRSSYGHLGEELVNYVAQNNLQDKNFIENMQDRVVQKKFFNALKEYITIEERPTTLEEFQQLTKKEEYAE